MDSDANSSEMESGASDKPTHRPTIERDADATYLLASGSWRLAWSTIPLSSLMENGLNLSGI